MRSRTHFGYTFAGSIDDRYAFFRSGFPERWALVELDTGEERATLELDGVHRASVGYRADQHWVLTYRANERALVCSLRSLPELEVLLEHRIEDVGPDPSLVGASADGTRALLHLRLAGSQSGELWLVDLPSGEILVRLDDRPWMQGSPGYQYLLCSTDADARWMVLGDPRGNLFEVDLAAGTAPVPIGTVDFSPSLVRLISRNLIAITSLGGQPRCVVFDRANRRTAFDSRTIEAARGGAHRVPMYCAANDRVLVTLSIPTRKPVTQLDVLTLDATGAPLMQTRVERPRLEQWALAWLPDGRAVRFEEERDVPFRVMVLERPGGAVQSVHSIARPTKSARIIPWVRTSARGAWLSIDVERVGYRSAEGYETHWARVERL